MNPIDMALNELSEALAAFVRLLERESETLQNIRAETLAEVVAEKSLWSQAANTAWNRLMIAAGIDAKRGERIEDSLAGQPDRQVKWREILRLTKAAERLNQANGVLIEAQMRRTRQALEVLQNAANFGALYDASGLIVEGYQSQHTLEQA